MSDGLVDITELNRISALNEMQKAVDEARAKIESGEFNVFDGVIKKQMKAQRVGERRQDFG